MVQKQSWLSGLTKIMIAHCQIIYLTDTFNVDIPNTLFEGFSILGNPS